MQSLESEQTVLEELDELRSLISRMREQGLKCLATTEYPKHCGAGGDLIATCGPVESARILWTLRRSDFGSLDLDEAEEKTRNENVRRARHNVSELRDDHLRRRQEQDSTHIPVFAAAKAIRALSFTIADEGDAKSLFAYLYRVAYEAFYVGEPFYVSGGARASERSEPTAFVTNACVRAAMSLIQVLRSIRRALECHKPDALRAAARQAKTPPWPNALSEWKERAEQRKESGKTIELRRIATVYGESTALDDIGLVLQRVAEVAQAVATVRESAEEAFAEDGRYEASLFADLDRLQAGLRRLIPSPSADEEDRVRAAEEFNAAAEEQLQQRLVAIQAKLKARAEDKDVNEDEQMAATGALAVLESRGILDQDGCRELRKKLSSICAANASLSGIVGSPNVDGGVVDLLRDLFEHRSNEKGGAGANSNEIERQSRLAAHQQTIALLRRIRRSLALPHKDCFGSGTEDNLREVQSALDKLTELEAVIVDRVLDRASVFLRAVIDRELAACQRSARGECDAAELCFAVAGFGTVLQAKMEQHDGAAARRAWSDPRVVRGHEALVSLLSEDGRLPLLRAFGVRASGYRLYPVGAEVIGALAHVVRKSGAQVEPSLLRKMVRYLELTRARYGPAPRGWMPDEPESDGRAHWWTTSIAIDAMAEVERMVSGEINRRIYRHFLTKYPYDLSDELTLGSLFYPDDGVAVARDEAGAESIAATLSRLQEHIVGVRLNKEHERLWSVALYGPPGTGKTTLLEALAKSAGVPLVEVTPSDILVQGTDHVESRARAVFNALAMLTDTVILFDEFDSVLYQRSSGGAGAPTQPTSVFQFLTPGMLPKLKKLHTRAKEQRIAYALATNHVASLDRAAIRKGRFDAKLGVYPPDALSRAGRLITEYARWVTEVQDAELATLPEGADVLDRIRAVVQETWHVPMPIAGQRGWFTAPKKGRKPKKGTPFEHLSKASKLELAIARECARAPDLFEGDGGRPTLLEEYLQHPTETPGGSVRVYLAEAIRTEVGIQHADSVFQDAGSFDAAVEAAQDELKRHFGEKIAKWVERMAEQARRFPPAP